MLLALGVVLALQVTGQTGPPPPRRVFVRDSSVADSTNGSGPRRLAVTPELLATAFGDDGARTLFYRARTARMVQDSSLRSYDATVRARASISMGIGDRGPERLAFRQEAMSRVRWQADVGARMEVIGARYVAPIIGSTETRHRSLEDVADGVGVVPYFPGHEPLWIGGTVSPEVDERRLVNPLADGAEAYYTYRLGDSLRITLADGGTIWIRELNVRPRSPTPNVVVGSLMFDLATGHLVRATYRLATPVDIAPVIPDSNTRARIAWAIGKAFVDPMRATISEVVIEYALQEGRFWMPRSRRMKGVQQMSFLRAPITMELAFDYASVNGRNAVSPIVTNGPERLPLDSIRAPDSLDAAAARKWRDSVGTARDSVLRAFTDSLAKAACDSTGSHTVARYNRVTKLTVAVSFPCDLEKLTVFPGAPASIYDPDDQLFGSAERDEIIARALGMASQAPVGLLRLPAPRLQYGASMTRFNRVEGLSTGLLVEQRFGGGYLATATGRFSSADHRLIGELSLGRTNLSRTIALVGYDRLVSASDWGRPLSFGSSVSALLLGRDEGFYYRAKGVELNFRSDVGPRLDWRFFAEEQRTAWQETTRSVSGDFGPNIVAAPISSIGAAARFGRSYGLDPRGFRTSADLRLEGAAGDSSYGRAAMDVTLSHGLPMKTIGSLTLAAGSTVGGVPVQRRWYLGGNQTVRGQRPDTAQSGNAFWMTRAEVGVNISAFRPSLFGDLGWVGERTMMSHPGRPLSGVGVGLSAFDGLVRLDVARGLYPRTQIRIDFSIGGPW